MFIMREFDYDDILPPGWQIEVGDDDVVQYRDFNTMNVVVRHPLSGTKKYLSAMPAHWTSCYDECGNVLFVNLITGSRSYVNPRLSLPFSLFPNGPPIKKPQFDGLTTVSEVIKSVFIYLEVLNDCDIAGKFVIILGGTSGVGLHLANLLVPRGTNVICLSREPPPFKWLPLRSFDYLDTPLNSASFWAHLDLARLQTVVDFAKNYYETGWPINSLIISIAILPEPSHKHKSADGFDYILQANVFAPILLIRLLLNRLRGTPNSTVVFVTCGGLRAHKVRGPEYIYSSLQPLQSDYETTTGRIQMHANAKFFQLSFACALRIMIQRGGNRYPFIYACCPGQLRKSKHIEKSTWSSWWWLKILRIIAFPFMKNMDCCTAGIAFCAFHPAANGRFYFEECTSIPLSEVISDQEMVRSVWDHVNEIMESKLNLPSWRG